MPWFESPPKLVGNYNWLLHNGGAQCKLCLKYVCILYQITMSLKVLTLHAKSAKVLFAYLFGKWWFIHSFIYLWFNKCNKTSFSSVHLNENIINTLSMNWPVDKTAGLLTFISTNSRYQIVICPYVWKETLKMWKWFGHVSHLDHVYCLH